MLPPRTQFTTTGIASWNNVEGDTMPDGYHALPGQQPHLKPSELGASHFQGTIDRAGGIGGFNDIRDAPLRTGVATNPQRVHGQMDDLGGLLSYLQADERLGLEPANLSEMSRRKEFAATANTGVLSSTGIGSFISADTAVGMPPGYMTSIVSHGIVRMPGSAHETLLRSAGGFSVSAADRRITEGGPVEDEVPLLPEDVYIDAEPAPKASRGGRGHVASGEAARSGEFNSAGGLNGFLNSLPKGTPAALPPTAFDANRVGQISKTGGLGAFTNDLSGYGPVPEGYLAAMPGFEWARNKSGAVAGPKGALGSNLFTFMTESAGDSVEGYHSTDVTGGFAKKATTLDAAFVGTLDRAGGLAGFYNQAVEASTGLLVPLPGEDVGKHRETIDLERMATSGKIEGAGGIGAFMMANAVAPEGYIADLAGENMRMVGLNEAHTKGTLERLGGLAGYYADHRTTSHGDDYTGFAWEDHHRKKMVDPLHHYGSLSAEQAAARAEAASFSARPDGLAIATHQRGAGVKMNAGRIGGPAKELAINTYEDRPSLLVKRVADNETKVVHTREVSMVAGKLTDARVPEIFNQLDSRGISLVQLRLENAAAAQQAREATMAEALAAQAALGNDMGPGSDHAPPPRLSTTAPRAVAQPSTPVSPREGYLSRYAAATPGSSAGTGVAPMVLPPSTPLVMPTPGGPAGPAVDVRRLARVRKSLRDVLPKKAAAAQSLLRSRLSREDGDAVSAPAPLPTAEPAADTSPSPHPTPRRTASCLTWSSCAAWLPSRPASHPPTSPSSSSIVRTNSGPPLRLRSLTARASWQTTAAWRRASLLRQWRSGSRASPAGTTQSTPRRRRRRLRPPPPRDLRPPRTASRGAAARRSSSPSAPPGRSATARRASRRWRRTRRRPPRAPRGRARSRRPFACCT
jgi:hypothetical protein